MKKILAVVAVVVLLFVITTFFVLNNSSFFSGEPRDFVAEMRKAAYIDAQGKEYPPDILLRKAIWCGDQDKMAALHEQGADITAPGPEGGRTPMHWAAASGRLAIIDYLLARGGTADAVSSRGFSPEGNTPLMEAAYYGYRATAEKLVDNGAAVDGPIPSGRNAYSPYMAAAFSNDMEMAEMLLEYGAKGAYASESGDNALTMALINGRPVRLEFVEFLVERGADVNTVVDKGTEQEFTPLIAAALAGRVDLYDFLVGAGADESYSDFFGHTAKEYLSGAAPKREIVKREKLQAATGDEYDFFYRISARYSNSGPCTAFMNGFAFAQINPGRMGFAQGDAGMFFRKGPNQVEVVWEEAVADEEEDAWNNDREVEISLQRTYLFGQSETLWSRSLKPQNPAQAGAAGFTFENPTQNDFSGLLETAKVCNSSSEEWKSSHSDMLKFAKKLLSAGASEITELARIRWTDEALADGKNIELEKESFRRAAKDLKSLGFGFKVRDDDQIVFLPNCGGRIWQVVVMDSPEEGRKLQEKVAMLPQASAPYDHDFFESAASEDGFGVYMKVFIANIDGEFAFVR